MRACPRKVLGHVLIVVGIQEKNNGYGNSTTV